MLIVDASALVLAVSDRTQRGQSARAVLAGDQRHAPHLIDAEVGNVFRRLVLRGELTARSGAQARLLAERTIHRRHRQLGALGQRAWQLRGNITFYDALYVALAETFACDLVTADYRLARAASGMCSVQAV